MNSSTECSSRDDTELQESVSSIELTPVDLTPDREVVLEAVPTKVTEPIPHTLVYDLSNIAYLGASLAGRDVELMDQAPERIQQATLFLMRKIYRILTPSRVIFACDHASYWRKSVYPDYKAQRLDTPLKQQVRKAIELIKLEKRQHCLEVPECEADDVIYGISKCVPGKITIVSSDSDFVQLESQRVQRFHPKALSPFDPAKNPTYDLFLKCIRGDASDNIPSAYPFVKASRVEAAFRNMGFHRQLMESVNRNGQRVGDCYEFNRKLIDMSCIPPDIFRRLQEAIWSFMDQLKREKEESD